MSKKRKNKCDRSPKRLTIEQENLEKGIKYIHGNKFLEQMTFLCRSKEDPMLGKDTPCSVTSDGMIRINNRVFLTPKQWANGIIHCALHLAFGHFDADKMPGYEVSDSEGNIKKVVECNCYVWNIACDAYISRFLKDMKFGESVYEFEFMKRINAFEDEREIYQYLIDSGEWKGIPFSMDMSGLENPVYYDEDECNRYAVHFACTLSFFISMAVYDASGCEVQKKSNPAEWAAEWFINRYPLLGSIAETFEIIYDSKVCIEEEIRIAAVDVSAGKIFVNPSARLGDEELKFILAHEYLHAGLQHQMRRQGRNPFLWNVACDYVVNAWLVEMQVGYMPPWGLLYDESLKGRSVEEIYDMILEDMKRFSKLDTFRGYGKGDMIDTPTRKLSGGSVDLEEFCRNALLQGLEYHQSMKRGTLPAELVQEIRALAVPPVPWDVELGRWMKELFPLPEKKRSYARASRRQGVTPDIPRPRYIKSEELRDGRTFGVVIDTSGSMSTRLLGMALGAIASYAAAREVLYARVVFCDARAYDAGFMSPEEIAGRVQVYGRGGTRLQPGIDLIENAKDFPKDGPILIITDGMIESHLSVNRKHAFLLPKGKILPFRAKGQVFYFDNDC